MKNKILSILITIFALCACMFTLTACDENEPHTHSYSKEEIAPTCITPGYNKHICSCGDIYTDAFINSLGHSFSNYVSNGDGTKTATCDREGCSQTDTITVNNENNQPTETSALQYTLSADNQGYIVIGIGTYDDNKLIIPSTHKNKPVIAIGDYAFYNCSSLTSVTIGDSVASIGEGAFFLCISLTSIEIPNSVKSIGSSAFSGCYKLVEVYNKSSLNITKGSSSYGDVGYYALDIYTQPFSSKLSTDNNGYIIYTNGSDKILVGYNGSETDLILPNGITAIYKYTFYSCDSLTSVVIPDSVTSIGYAAFYGCYSLTSIEIPNSVTSIGDYAFYYCYKLVEVYNKSSLNITKGSFDYGCVGYYAIDIYTQPYNSKMSTDNNGYIIYTNGSDKILVGYNGSETDLILPNGITAIYNYAFYNCSKLTSIEIPNSVTSIGDSALEHCSKLTSIEIPNSVTSIGSLAFRGCSSLTSVTIGDSVTSIGYYAFSSCYSLTSVTIGDSVTSIGESAFAGCYKLVEVYNKSSLNITKGNSSYGDVGYYALNIYTKTSGASKLSTDNNGYIIYTNGSDKILVGYNGSETDLILPNGITAIYNYAFYNCNKLTSIKIPNSVTNIGYDAFYGCYSLTSIEIPNSVTSIGDYAFAGCSSLTSIEIPDSVTSIGDSAFYYCSSLTSVTIGDSVTSIGKYAFYNCSSLTSVVIGNSVTSIGYWAFYNCSLLTSITFKDTSTWYITDDYSAWQNKAGGTEIDVSYALSYLTDEYYFYKL